MLRFLAASAAAMLVVVAASAVQAAPKSSGARNAEVTEFGSSHRNRRLVWAKDPAKHYWRQYRPPVPCSIQPTYPCDPEAYFGLYTRPYKYSPTHYASFRYYGPVKPYYPGASWW